MNNMSKRTYINKTFIYEFRDKVIKTDYYKDHLVTQLPLVMNELLSKKKKIRALDMATGHGYTAVILSNYYENNIVQLVVDDINPRAVDLARYNILANKCNIKKIDFRIGSLYEPLHEGETFDLIVSTLPPVPVLSDELALLPEDIKVHHWVASTAGITGRDLLDEMIHGAYDHLNPGGW